MKVDLESRYRGRRVCLFGGSGFIGRWVAHRLVSEGAHLTCFARSPDRASQVLTAYGVSTSVLPGSLDRREELAAALERANPEVTFNLIAYGVDPRDEDPRLARLVNAEFPEWLAATLSSFDTEWDGNRLVHVGTQYEYGAVPDFHEDAVANPTTLYGETKLAGSEALLSVSAVTGLKAVTARVFNVFGPGEGGHRLLPTLIAKAKDREPIDLTSGRQVRDFCVVHDVAEGLLRLGCAAPLGGDPVNLASGKAIPVRDLVVEAAHQLQIERNLLRFGALPDRAQEAPDPRVSVERLRHLTGWLPETTLSDGIRRTVAFVPGAP